MGQSLPANFTEQLALALIYLSSWEEKEYGSSVHRAWKGYEFPLLDRLKEQDLVHFSPTAKSLYLTEEGVEKAKELVSRLSKSLG